jgi:2-polyprenyl-6-methoxyphenol hydroxylase-like FAD-dependent oxidoreductase
LACRPLDAHRAPRSYPLTLTRRNRFRPRRAHRAAQALHPVAGQGFYFGFSDAAVGGDAGSGSNRLHLAAELLENFAVGALKIERESRFTDSLVKLFGSNAGRWLVRSFGLLMFDMSPRQARCRE